LPGAIYDQELVFEQKELGNEGTDAARLEQLGQNDDQVDEKDDALKRKNGSRTGNRKELWAT
jgi:hypothetical protein